MAKRLRGDGLPEGGARFVEHTAEMDLKDYLAAADESTEVSNTHQTVNVAAWC